MKMVKRGAGCLVAAMWVPLVWAVAGLNWLTDGAVEAAMNRWLSEARPHG